MVTLKLSAEEVDDMIDALDCAQDNLTNYVKNCWTDFPDEAEEKASRYTALAEKINHQREHN